MFLFFSFCTDYYALSMQKRYWGVRACTSYLHLRHCSTFSWDSITLSHPFTSVSNRLRSLWIHQGNLFCLLVLVLHIFNILFQRTSHVPVSACVKHEGRSKCICWHVQRVHNRPFLVWKGTYNCMHFCVFTKIASSVWKKGRICLYLCNHFLSLCTLPQWLLAVLLAFYSNQ